MFSYETLYHRGFGWRPLYGEETNPWVIDTLIPKLKDLTGVEWTNPGGNLLHTRGEIIISLKSVFEDNDIAKILKKNFPMISENDLGYKLEKLKCVKKDIYVYEGVWALSTYSIIERGKTAGKKFGL